MASGTSDLIVRLSLDTTQFEGSLFKFEGQMTKLQASCTNTTTGITNFKQVTAQLQTSAQTLTDKLAAQKQKVADAYAFMDMRNDTSATFEGVHRVDHRAYPPAALREALLNAIVHRDYVYSASTLISVYRDRMEIVSVGSLTPASI